MRFLIDRCAGRRLAEWLRSNGHDVVEVRELGPNPGDRALLDRAANEKRILVTIDTDFGKLIHLHDVAHTGIVRLPDVPAQRRIALIAGLIEHHEEALETGAVVTIRISEGLPSSGGRGDRRRSLSAACRQGPRPC